MNGGSGGGASFPYTGSAAITGSLTVTGSTNLRGSGSNIFTVNGTSGRLFEVNDNLSGSLFSVNDISGIPVLEAFSDGRVRIGEFGREAIKISGSFATTTGSLQGTASYATNALNASNALSSSFALTASYFTNQSSGNATASFTNSSTWTFLHNLNNRNVLVQTYDSSFNQIIPQNITLTDANTVTIVFPVSISGYAIASLGGISVSGAGGGTSTTTTTTTTTTTSGIVSFNLQTGSYTLAASDVSKIVRVSSSVSCSVTLPDNTSVPMATGSFITIEQAGTGLVTAATGSGVTILPTARTTFGQYKVIQCYKIDTNICNELGGIV
jgi:hypothetical protein